LLSKHGLDVLIVVAAVGSAFLTAFREVDRPTGAMQWFEALAIGGVVLTLLGRKRFPFGAPATLWLVCAALSFVDGRLVVDNNVVYVAGMGSALLLGNLRNDTQARIGLAIVIGGAAIVVYNAPGPARLGGLLFTPLLFALGWLVGFALRARTEQTEAAEERALRAERDREAAARVAVAEERGRIARELHDVVAHAVSVMVLQVGAVRHRMPESDTEDRDTLRNVEQAGRTALAEMRRLLSAMRAEGDELELLPHPGLDDLGTLVDDVRAAGLPVSLQVEGDAFPLPPGLDLSAYRILQEGLTNTLKHAQASEAQIQVRYEPAELRLEVRDDGRGRPASTADPGHGLVGIGERVKIYGGEMSVGRSAQGGFLLRVRLPVDGGDQ
jgi:signal transduction histidine kinase